MAERTFTCFGGACTVLVEGDGAADAVIAARDRLLAWHEVFTRFKPESELSRLNGDPRERVPVSPMMARFAAAAVAAAEATGGLVDPTLLEEIEEAGYRSDRLHGRRPGHGARPHRAGGRGAREGGGAERPGGHGGLAPARRRRRARRRLASGSRGAGGRRLPPQLIPGA